MAAMREAVGDDIDIMVDCHGRHFPANAIEFCRVLAPYRPYFIEEPVPPENVDALAEVRKASPVPIASGERVIGPLRFSVRFLRSRHATSSSLICATVVACGKPRRSLPWPKPTT